MLLSDCETQIDAGKTAKLFITPDLPSSLRFTVLIKRVEGGYAWQHIIHTMNIAKVVTSQVVSQTVVFPEWAQLLEGIKGVQTDTLGWLITDDALLDYLPPERKTVPTDAEIDR